MLTKNRGAYGAEHYDTVSRSSGQFAACNLLNTSVIPHVICDGALSNSSASSVTVRDTVKKSKASHDQAKKATRKNIHCWKFSIRTSLIGFGALTMGGLRVGIRVAR